MIAQALNEIKSEMGDHFDLEKVNLAELERRTGISRARLRHAKENGFVFTPHALIGRKAETTVLSGFTGIIDSLLQKGVKNSAVVFERLQENGYTGGKTSVKDSFSKIISVPDSGKVFSSDFWITNLLFFCKRRELQTFGSLYDVVFTIIVSDNKNEERNPIP